MSRQQQFRQSASAFLLGTDLTFSAYRSVNVLYRLLGVTAHWRLLLDLELALGALLPSFLMELEVDHRRFRLFIGQGIDRL